MMKAASSELVKTESRIRTFLFFGKPRDKPLVKRVYTLDDGTIELNLKKIDPNLSYYLRFRDQTGHVRFWIMSGKVMSTAANERMPYLSKTRSGTNSMRVSLTQQ
jgi:hypothetical protein